MARRSRRALAWAFGLGGLALLAACGAPPAETLTTRQASAPNAGRDAPELTAWYPLVFQENWPGDLLLSAVGVPDGLPVHLTVVGYDIIEDSFLAHLLATAAAGRAPDVAYLSDTGELIALVEAGVLEPLTGCRAAQPALDGIPDNLWSHVVGHGETWAIPAAQDLSAFFFNKPKLRALGWSEAAIDALPQRIATGDFTLLDLRDTAVAAIAAGIVEPGFGFSQRPSTSTKIIEHYLAVGGRLYDAAQDRLVIDEDALAETYALRQTLLDERIISPYLLDGSRNSWSARLVWHDAIAHGRALFWHSQLADWPKWQLIAASSTRSGTSPKTGLAAGDIGLAVLPSAVAGQGGTVRTRVVYFVVLNQAATGRRQQPQACALLAQAMTPALHSAITSPIFLSALYALPTTPSTVVVDGYPAGIDRLGENQLKWPSILDHDVVTYQDIMLEFAAEVQAGRLTPTAAAAAATRQLRRVLGDDLTVE